MSQAQNNTLNNSNQTANTMSLRKPNNEQEKKDPAITEEKMTR